MTSVLGVDGGQTGIRVGHSVVDRIVEVPGVGRQEGDPVRGVADAVGEAWHRGGFPPVDRVVLGLTTAPEQPAAATRLAQLVADTTDAPEVWVTDDAVTSHAGALSGCPGVAVIAGTGVASMAVRPSGEAQIVGGHGYLLGDEGGGFWIGRAGLRAALRAVDGRGDATLLTELAARRFGPLDSLDVRIHDAERPVQAIAAFATDVLEAANSRDAVAGAIVEEAAHELRTLIGVAAAWVGGEAVDVALGGRLLEAGSGLRTQLDGLLAESGEGLRARSADGTGLDGAIQLGLANLEGPYASFIRTWSREHPA